MKKQNGFTLVEMLITIAIFALLLVLAYPNYQQHLARGRQEEARSALLSMFIQESTFKAETNSFTLCLSNIGYNPANSDVKRYYAVGYGAGTAAAHGGCGITSVLFTSCLAYSWTGAGAVQDTCVEGNGTTYFNNTVAASEGHVPVGLNQGWISSAAFIAHAEGYVLSGGARDVWTITEAKLISNASSGL
jgi:prepilin-type N-terminal cleavage/methylation domain-containing protein